ncbi:glycosyl transferase family 1 [Nocardioides sp. Root1257]|uniref:glycosyltransferase family 4 protein n=1 Tax=unclassified Nocardioides TaxID=2615069 RepID=UPI0006F4C8C5|nr:MULTISPECIES: glycosyltransferase family 4 protein [unclassified Nocardioides]KQW48844.1 glycosyl transferase family 1 [Nocardioides sp. Root1257]KRC48019.1 glycosyl transferase family 1 [Nocardioides sp. Root224]
MAERTHVLVIVQNLPVPLDRRVWLECLALRDAGYDVSVICPKGPGDPARQVIDGIHVYKYRPAPQASGVLGYAVEFGYSWLRTAKLSRTAWRRQPFDALQACNPPDTYWALARYWKRRGVRFVFDQHDLNPELFLSRFGEPEGRSGKLQLAGLRWLERQTYATADHVISTNESYRRIAIERGERDPRDVTVVRSGPDTTVMRPVHPSAPAGPGARHSLVYLGIMGPQDGVDMVLEVMDELVHRRGRTDVEATLLGFGDCLADLQRQCHDLGLDDVVTFTGRAGPAAIAEHLSAASVGLCPDRKTPLNDVSTMNKTMEYMAHALPSVSFDLTETRVSGGDSCLYVPSGDVQAFADAVERLLDDPELRVDLARRAWRRVSLALDWKPQSTAYVGVYDRLLRRTRDEAATTAAPRYVDMSREAEVREFVLARGPQAPDHAAAV